MRQIAIIADDLTGASDAGVQFARKGLATTLLFDTRSMIADSTEVEALAIDTDSRAIASAEAYQRAWTAAEYVAAAGFAHVYKKVDSTLRGNLGQEIDGVMDGAGCDVAVIAPAFPRMGRTTVAGHHYLNGRPIHETEIARDPKCPVHESYLPALLSNRSRRRTGTVDLAVVREGVRSIRLVARSLVSAGAQLLVCDAETDSDLAAIACAMAGPAVADEVWARAGRRLLWVGSAGLADCLPAALQLTPAARPQDRPARARGPVLLLAGSVSEITRAQAGLVAAQPDVVLVQLDPLQVLSDGPARTTELERCHSALAAALGQDCDVVFTPQSAPERVAAAKAAGVKIGLDGTGVADRVAAALGETGAAVLRRCPVRGAILTGGDTAKAVCRELGATGLQLLSEVETGVPLSRLVGGLDLTVITKAGAFGGAETLLRAMQTLKEEG